MFLSYRNAAICSSKVTYRLAVSSIHSKIPTDDKRVVSQPAKDLQTSSAKKSLMSPESLDQSFTDYETSFRAKTTAELIRAVGVFRLCSFNFIVDYNKEVSFALNVGVFLLSYLIIIPFFYNDKWKDFLHLTYRVNLERLSWIKWMSEILYTDHPLLVMPRIFHFLQHGVVKRKSKLVFFYSFSG